MGCGAAGLVDGSYEAAAFYRPQGLAYSPKVRRRATCPRTRRGREAAAQSVPLHGPHPLGRLILCGASQRPCQPASSAPRSGKPHHASATLPLAQRDCLYVADTEAHALREIDLRRKTVTTLAGAPRPRCGAVHQRRMARCSAPTWPAHAGVPERRPALPAAASFYRQAITCQPARAWLLWGPAAGGAECWVAARLQATVSRGATTRAAAQGQRSCSTRPGMWRWTGDERPACGTRPHEAASCASHPAAPLHCAQRPPFTARLVRQLPGLSLIPLPHPPHVQY